MVVVEMHVDRYELERVRGASKCALVYVISPDLAGRLLHGRVIQSRPSITQRDNMTTETTIKGEAKKEERKKEEAKKEEAKKEEAKIVLPTVEIKANIALIERGVAELEPRFTHRVLRSLTALRKRIDSKVLRDAIEENYPAGVYIILLFFL